MNKKVLTLCAALLLSSSSFVSVYADTNFKAGGLSSGMEMSLTEFTSEHESVALSSDGLKMTIAGEVDYSDPKDYLLINEDDFVLEGNGNVWKGRIVITGENVTINNLKIDYTNVLESGGNGQDGSVIENKSAITVFASKVTITNCEISCKTTNPNFMANGITIYPLSSTPEFTITRNTITGANNIVAGVGGWADAPSFGIEILGGIPNQAENGYTHFTSTDKDGYKAPETSAIITDFSKSNIQTTGISESATDFGYIEVDGVISNENRDPESYKMVQVEPNADNKAALTKALTHAAEGATFIFEGTEAQFYEAIAGEDLSNVNVAVQCDGIALLIGDAEAPAGVASKPVELNEDGSIVIDLLADKAEAFQSGRYYLLQNSSNQIVGSGWNTTLYENVSDKAPYLWTIDEILTTSDDVAYATLKNKNGDYFYGGGNNSSTKFAVKLTKNANGAWIIDYGTNDYITLSPVNNLGTPAADDKSKD